MMLQEGGVGKAQRLGPNHVIDDIGVNLRRGPGPLLGIAEIRHQSKAHWRPPPNTKLVPVLYVDSTTPRQCRRLGVPRWIRFASTISPEARIIWGSCCAKCKWPYAKRGPWIGTRNLSLALS